MALVEDEVRLNAGYFTFVDHGPLVVEGIPWYRIGSRQQPGEAELHTMNWDADGDGDPVDGGWVAGASDGNRYLIPAEVPPLPGPQFGPGPDPYAVLSAIGDARSITFRLPPGNIGMSVEWYAADPDGQACDLRVTVQPDGDEVDSATVQGWADGRQNWPPNQLGAEGDFGVELKSDCSWSVTVRPLVG